MTRRALRVRSTPSVLMAPRAPTMAYSWLMGYFRLVAPTPRRSLSSSLMVHLRVLVDSKQVLPIAPSKAPRVSRIKVPTFIRSASLMVRIPLPILRTTGRATKTSSCTPCRATIQTPRPIQPMSLVSAPRIPISTRLRRTPMSSRRCLMISRALSPRARALPLRSRMVTTRASPATSPSVMNWATLCRSMRLLALRLMASPLMGRPRQPRAIRTRTSFRAWPGTWSSPSSALPMRSRAIS